METDRLFERYRELQRYVGWTDEDAGRVRALAPLVAPHFPELVNDFYEEIQRHPDALKVITGGREQIGRLKGTLTGWLRELVAGRYDAEYVARRWQVGYRHVEIGLDQVFTNSALSRLRRGLLTVLERNWPGSSQGLLAARSSLNTLLDLDLAIIEDAYQTEYTFRRETAERLATIGQMAGGVAHELRNPLNVIKTSVYYVLNARNPRPGKVAEHLHRIEKQVGLADGVITALSNFAKLPLPNRQRLAVELFLRETVETTPLPEHIALLIDCPADLPAALADGDQLRIVISNLIRNACDAMREGGQLTIAAHDGASHVDIAVSDTGPGIAPENIQRIMEPLFSTKARGIGLGLAIAKAIVDKNSGRLSVHSEPGRGATFTVRLEAVPNRG